MHDCIVWALLKGVPGSRAPWSQEAAPAFLCPVPGYDRHFAMCEEFGIRMIAGAADRPTGRTWTWSRRLVARPGGQGHVVRAEILSNPTGEIYSDETVRRLAAMKTGAPDFRLFWDNAYAVHHLTPSATRSPTSSTPATQAGHPDRAFVFASTSKITLAGAGLALLRRLARERALVPGAAGKRTIGADKLNQLRHVRFLKDAAGLDRPHGAAPRDSSRRSSRPSTRRSSAASAGPAWRPGAGPRAATSSASTPSTARAERIVALAKDAGIALTPAGATFPYGRDPHDAALRLAPSFPEPLRGEARRPRGSRSASCSPRSNWSGRCGRRRSNERPPADGRLPRPRHVDPGRRRPGRAMPATRSPPR